VRSGTGPEPASDTQLLERLKAGEREAGDLIIERHKRLVAHAVWEVVHDLGAVEDLIQDIFIKAFRKIHLYNPAMGRFSVWLVTVSRNEAINHLRRLKRNRLVLMEDVGGETHASPLDRPSQQFSRKETWSRIMGAVQRLSEPARTIVVQRLIESRSFQEIGRELRRPTETVKSIFYRATSDMREQLGKLG
jgi:RNA polymerase sigma-70 factor (ECF subfamily)